MITTADLFGILADRWLMQQTKEIERRENITKIQNLVTAELLDIAAGMIVAKEYMDAAVATANAGGSLPSKDNLRHITPQRIPFTDNLGTTLLLLGPRQNDVLAILRLNLAVTSSSMDEVTVGQLSFGLLSAQALRESIRCNMQIVAKAFDKFALLPAAATLLVIGADRIHAGLKSRLAT